MTKKLKGIILSVADTIINMGDVKEDVFTEVIKLMKLLKLKGIKPVLLANQKRTITIGNETSDLYEYLEKTFDDLIIFTRLRDDKVPAKPRADATAYVLKEMKWERNEVLYLGSNDTDMRTAVNGGLLFLRATWYSQNTNYGFEFNSPKEVARFIDTLCLREHFWSHEIKDDDFEYYSLAPFSTYKEEFKKYSENARAAAKFGDGDVDFWLGALVTSLYFTGIYERINFVAPYPGHKAGFDNDKMNADLMTFSKCFRIGYLHNLIERHTNAQKSQTARINGIPIDHHNQLNTIKLTQLPNKNYSEHPYTRPPLSRDKTVLLVDDICTKGYSLDAARKHINMAGAKTIMVSWLKTINTNFCTIGDTGKFNPYVKNKFTNIPAGKEYNYHTYHVDGAASEELGEQLEQYISWDWPRECL